MTWVVAVIYIGAFISPWIFIAVPFMMVVCYYITSYFLRTYRQLCLLSSTTHSPIMTHASESISGNATIRAFKQQEKFSQANHKNLDQNTVTYFWMESVDVWFAV